MSFESYIVLSLQSSCRSSGRSCETFLEMHPFFFRSRLLCCCQHRMSFLVVVQVILVFLDDIAFWGHCCFHFDVSHCFLPPLITFLKFLWFISSMWIMWCIVSCFIVVYKVIFVILSFSFVHTKNRLLGNAQVISSFSHMRSFLRPLSFSFWGCFVYSLSLS